MEPSQLRLLQSKSSEESNSEAVESEKPIGIYDNVLHCDSSVLASKIRKVAPSITFDNRKSSVASVMEKELKSLIKKKITVANSFKKVRLTEDSTEVIVDNLETNNDIDENKIKNFPVSIQEKRIHRESIFIPPVSWQRKLKISAALFYSKVGEFHIWKEHLKIIEGRFGAGVVSYFLFIRWLLTMNLVIFFMNFIILVFPHMIFTSVQFPKHNVSTFHESWFPKFYNLGYANINEKMLRLNKVEELYEKTPKEDTSLLLIDTLLVGKSSDLPAKGSNMSKFDIIAYCYKKYRAEIASVMNGNLWAQIQNFLQGTGMLEPTVLFLGHYPNKSRTYFGFTFNVPIGFIMVFLATMIVCFIMMIRYSTFGMQEAFLTQHDFLHFTNDVLCAWDYCIRNYKAAALCHQNFTLEIKINLSEVRRKKEISGRSTITWIKLYTIRFFVNVLVILWITTCYWLISMAVDYQLKEQSKKNLTAAGFRTLLIQYLPPFTMILIGSISPFIFNFLVSFEKYHGQKEVNISVFRNVFLSLSSIIVLVITVHRQITCEPKDICGAGMSLECHSPRCWETYVGQELYKLGVSQLFVMIAVFLFHDIPRNFIVKKYRNKFTILLGRACFFLPTEVLLPVYSQTILWLGVFYSPLLPSITIIMLILLFYVKKAKVLKYSEPAQLPYKASRFNSTFTNILMISFFVVVIFHMYILVHIRPSLGCGPFRTYDSMIEALEGALKSFPIDLFFIWNCFFSGWFFIPAVTLMCAIIYYYWKYNAFLASMETKLKAEIVLMSKDNQFLLSKMDSTKKFV